MRKIIISHGGTKASIMPAFGGMVSSFIVDEIEVLRMKEENLGIANCLSGGIPVLFPFCSKVKDDTYFSGGRQYTMPMHGFVKDMPFGVKKISEDSVTVFATANEAIMSETYPFDFMLRIEYKVADKSLSIKANIDNLSEQNMPYYIGWHTYFKSSDKKKTKFTFDFQEYTSYIDGSKGKVSGNTVDLTQSLDHVYTGMGSKDMVLTNFADGYEAVTIADDMHQVLTIYTGFDDCVCIEPWTAVPNAINTGELLRHVAPKSSVECGFEIKVKLL